VLLLARLAFLAIVVLGQTTERQVVVHQFPDGSVREKYEVDSEGRKHGRYVNYHSKGKPHIVATYERGLLDGTYKEFDEEGRLRREATYRRGALHGRERLYEDGKLVADQVWLEGRLLYPKTLRLLIAGLARIRKAAVPLVGGGDERKLPRTRQERQEWLRERAAHAKRVEAVRTLMAYRFICDVPWEDMALDRHYNEACEAAAELLARLGRLDHTPPNPGLPEDRFKLAYEGTSHSNLSVGPDMVGAVHSFMNDSDPGNIAHVGHRRWLLNPRMLKTGLGSRGRFTAMWSMDRSREKAGDYDYVAFPARGYMPRRYFNSHYAWCVILNPAKFARPAKKDVKVEVYLVNQRFQKAKRPLKLNYFNVSTAGYGSGPAIIFRPEGVRTSHRSRYMVEVSGLRRRSGQPTGIEYLVEFVDLP